MKSFKKIQISITIAALIVLIIHIFHPSINIDVIALTLIIIAMIPWMIPLLKSLELPGGIKFEFQELEKVTEEAEEAGLLSKTSSKIKSDYGFMSLIESSPGLALAGLRIELEKSLRNLAEKENVKLRYGSISFLIKDLHHKKIISTRERTALADIIVTLNKAAHGYILDNRAIEWAKDIGPQILDNLNERLKTSK